MLCSPNSFLGLSDERAFFDTLGRRVCIKATQRCMPSVCRGPGLGVSLDHRPGNAGNRNQSCQWDGIERADDGRDMGETFDITRGFQPGT